MNVKQLEELGYGELVDEIMTAFYQTMSELGTLKDKDFRKVYMTIHKNFIGE